MAPLDTDRPAAARDEALSRLRRGTAVAVGACAALTAAFAGLAASFTTGRHTHATTVATSPSVARRTASRPVVAPAPKLVAVDSSSSPPPQSSSSASVTQAPAAAAPAVVSGGS